MIAKHNDSKCKNNKCGIIFPRRVKGSRGKNNSNLRGSNCVTCFPECSKKYKAQDKYSRNNDKTRNEEGAKK